MQARNFSRLLHHTKWLDLSGFRLAITPINPRVNQLTKTNNALDLQQRYNHQDHHPFPPLEDYLDLRIERTGPEETYIEGIPINTGREDRVIKIKSEACALCRLNLVSLKYTDVMILGQFIKRDGSLVTYKESKLCKKQYSRIRKMITMAQRCNIIKRPDDYLVPGPWHDLNTYLEWDRKRDQPMKVIKKQYWKL